MQITTGVSFTHSINTAPCNTYHSTLVEVSADGGTNWFSSGATYTDLLTSANNDFTLVLEPKVATFDAGTTDFTRKIRLSVKATYASQAVQTQTYSVTIKPLSKIAVLADSNTATTLTLTSAHPNVVYNVGQGILTVPTTSMTVNAPTATSNTGIRVMDTVTRLFY